ncbi:MAG: CbtA family protein [Acetobacteraceae bacterium]
MVRTLLIRGMLVGILAGVLGFAFAWLLGEPQVDIAIAFEDHMHQIAGDPPDPVLVSRAVQSTVGLFTGVVVYSCALGGIFALVFAYAYGRLGRLSPRATAAILAAAGLVVLILVPQIKYPANPPSIGNPATIDSRTALYFGMIACSVIAAVASLMLGRSVRSRLDNWNATLIGGGVYVVAMLIVMLVLPPVNEVPADFSAATLWAFRLVSFGINVVVWTTLGLAFGALTQRHLEPRIRYSVRSRFAGSA